MANKKVNRWAPVIVLVLLLAAWLVVKMFAGRQDAPQPQPGKKQQPAEKVGSKGLNRTPAAINYSKHARCRMDCRKISESEVKDILLNGKINYSKSDIGNLAECRRKYAVEGKTRDGQRVRIIFAPCNEEVTVVTVIDLGKEWPCDCD